MLIVEDQGICPPSSLWPAAVSALFAPSLLPPNFEPEQMSNLLMQKSQVHLALQSCMLQKEDSLGVKMFKGRQEAGSVDGKERGKSSEDCLQAGQTQR